ncbi:MAG: imelysin family protein [Saprospiraceae bacterium]|nr:imelysin family protein [Saprospiraceae bacterium]
MRLRILFHFSFFCFLVLWMVSCDSESGIKQDFDRGEILSNYARNVVQPAFERLLVEVNTLDDKTQQFVDVPSEGSLVSLQQAWQSVYIYWQNVNAFNFGPAGEDGLRKSLIEEIGTWPVSSEKVEAAITAQDHSLSGFDRDARGFLAIGYLLFNPERDISEILQQFQQSDSRFIHLKALTSDVASRVEEVVREWASYEQDFIANDGTDIGSSISQFYNEWVRSFEAIKNFKVGLPLGKRPGQTQSEPRLVEALHSGNSLETIKAHLLAIESVYYGGGSSTNEQRPSLKTYLENVVGGPDLIVQTEAQWRVVMDALQAVPADRSFQELIIEEHPSLDVLHTELQRHTRFFKSDMSSLLGIAITFSSGDGD